MQTEKAPKHYAQRIAKILLKVVLFIILFIVIVFLLILTPPVQKFLTGKAENFLENKLKTKVEIGGISIGLPRRVSLNNIYVEDRTKDTLLYGGSIKADIALLKLLSSEVEVKDLKLTDITAKIKRVLPDTIFNFQFIVDAFAPKTTPTPTDTTAATLKMAVDNFSLDNVRIVYDDVVTGNDMMVHVDDLAAKIDSLNPTTSHYDIRSLDVNKVVARIKQTKPLATSEPVAKDKADAAQPITMKLNFGTVTLDNIDVVYGNDVSAFYTDLKVGHLLLDGKNLDLQNRIIQFDELKIDNTSSAIKLGKKEAAKVVVKEAAQEVAAQGQNNWVFKVANVEFNNNTIAFDNDNLPVQRYGMDYAHLRADSLTLHIKDFVFNTDSIGLLVTKGYFKEKSGFQLDDLQGNLLYANNQSYLKDLYLKTPGTELKRSIILEYASLDALTKNFPQTVMDIDIANSRVQVKDILTFAPQLRSQPAFSNPSQVWRMNIQGSGTMNRLHVEALQFAGLNNTVIDASGVLAGLTNPNAAGGTFTIRKLHTSQSDIALFTGQRLSTAQINLPETFDISGTLAGTMANLATNLNLVTSSGNIGLNGRFANLTKPTAATYNATITTHSLQLGSILRNKVPVGALSAAFTLNGKGFTPDAINTKIKGTVYSIGYNKYTYKNVALNGSLNKTAFTANLDVSDPNIDITVVASGNLSANPTFKVNAVIDSVKTLPLHFTTETMVFRGNVNGEVRSFTPDFLDANLLLTSALLVSGPNRLALDSLEVVSGKNDTAQFIRLTSDIANAQIIGQYRLAELGSVIQDNIQPYYALTPSHTTVAVKPYDFRFTADIANSPALAAFMPGLNIAEPIHAEGSLASGQGLQALITTPSLIFGTNTISGLNVRVTTTPQGLQVAGIVGQLKSGNSFNIYNTRLNATALNNIIDFNLRVGDINDRDKYYLGGIFSQPATGTYALQLKPDSLLLNYEPWTIAAGNSLTITPTNVLANAFTLQKGLQQLSLQSEAGGDAQPLNVSFASFRLATITGFVKSDSLLVDGVMNGTVRFSNLMKQPLFTSNLTINDLSLKQDTIGNINLQVSNSTENKYVVNTTLTGKGNDVQITGSLIPQDKDIAIDLAVAVRNLELSSMEGALATAFKNASGTINGNIAVSGTSAKPDIQGELAFNKARFNTVFLGGDFTIDNEKLKVTPDGFFFDQFSIRDSANHALTLNGTVLTPNFINYNFNLDVNANNFRTLNTTKKDNKIYYGQLYINTDLHIAGTEVKPIVDGTLTINDNTNLSVVIPQAEPGVVEREGIIEFVDMDNPGTDSLFLAYDSLNKSTITGLDVNVNIDIKKEAVMNVIVDEANGDFLNVRGEGLLTAGIDPSGKITLTGTYQMEEGAYEMSYSLLRRRFIIEKGSKITWLGEPTRADLAVTAIYVARTSPMDLVQDQSSESNATLKNQYFQKLPFEVHLNVSGELLKPALTFDIILPDRNYTVAKDVVENVNIRLSQLRQEPSELNKQVFALLLLNRFVGENPFESSGGSGFNATSFAKQSVSKLLTEQLNNLASGLISGVDLTFDVASTDDYTTGERRDRTDLNVGLSKRLLNDRLTVSVGSNFELEGPQSGGNQSSNNIIGNVNINYQLSKDGRYMLRAYRRNEYQGQVDGYVIETGLGFSINIDYNRFREILHAKKVREEREKRRAANNPKTTE